MFVVSAVVYPCVLALLCLGAGLAVDRASGRFLPGVLIPLVGVAGLIAVAQLTTYLRGIAPATRWVRAAVGASGLAMGWARIRWVAQHWRAHRWQLALPP